MDKKPPQNLILWFFLACFITSIYFMGWLLSPFFSIIVLSVVVTGVFYPVYRFVRGKGKIRKSVASLITCVMIFIILFIPIVIFVGSLTQEAYGLLQMARGAVLDDQINDMIRNSQIVEMANQILSRFDIVFTGEELNKAISEVGKNVGLFLYQQARTVASNTLSLVINFFLMLLVIFFLLIDGEKLVQFIVDLSPLPADQDEKLIQKFSDMAGAVLIGNGLCGIIQGTAGGIIFWVFGLQSAFLWGVIMSLLAFLPIIGIGVVFIPTAIYLFLKGRMAVSIIFLVFYVLLSGGIEYILKPKLVGNKVKMHTLLVFFSIIGGLKIFGILGIIYGPLIATAFLTLTDIYHVSYQNFVEPTD